MLLPRHRLTNYAESPVVAQALYQGVSRDTFARYPKKYYTRKKLTQWNRKKYCQITNLIVVNFYNIFITD